MCAFPLPSMTKILRTICYLCAPPHPLCLPTPPAENYEHWAALTFLRTAKRGGASALVLGQWRTHSPYHTYPWLANGRLEHRLTWRLSVRSLSSQRSIPASAGITEDLTPAESDVRRPRRDAPGVVLCKLHCHPMTLSHPVDENDPWLCLRSTLGRLQNAESQGQDNNAQKL